MQALRASKVRCAFPRPACLLAWRVEDSLERALLLGLGALQRQAAEEDKQGEPHHGAVLQAACCCLSALAASVVFASVVLLPRLPQVLILLLASRIELRLSQLYYVCVCGRARPFVRHVVLGFRRSKVNHAWGAAATCPTCQWRPRAATCITYLNKYLKSCSILAPFPKLWALHAPPPVLNEQTDEQSGGDSVID